MKVLLDTNVIIRAAQPSLPTWQEIDQSLSILVSKQITLCLVPQIIYEFWVVATRPVAQNGFALAPHDAKTLVDNTLEQFTLLRDERGIFDEWSTLVATYGVSGKAAHDARLVAAMKRHAISSLVTFNDADFTRFPIFVFTPKAIISGTVPTQ